MTLEEIEQRLQKRLRDLQADRDEGFEIPPFSAWLEVYQVLAQVKQAMAAERIAGRLDGWNMSGVPVENVP